LAIASVRRGINVLAADGVVRGFSDISAVATHLLIRFAPIVAASRVIVRSTRCSDGSYRG
jgi:hypothetical protein